MPSSGPTESCAWRGTIVKDMIIAVERLPLADRENVLSAMPRGMVESIQGAMRIAWIHADKLAALSNALVEALGTARAEEFWVEFSIRASTSSFLGAMHTSGLRIFGVKPSGFMRNFVVAHRMTTRDMGTLKADIDDSARRGTLVYSEVPSKYLDDSFVVSSRAAVRAMFKIMDINVQLTPDTSRCSQGRLTFDLTWA